MHRCNSSSSGTYKFPLYLTHPPSSVHSAMVISCNPVFVQIASNILPGSGSISYAYVISLEIEGRPWAGGLSANKRNCSCRFCGFRTTHSIFLNLSSPRQVGLPAWSLKYLLSLSICLVGEQSRNQIWSRTLTTAPVVNS